MCFYRVQSACSSKHYKNVFIIGDCAKDAKVQGKFIGGCPPLPSISIVNEFKKYTKKSNTMKIKDVKVFPLSFPLSVPAQDATGVWYNWNTIIVKVIADDGTFGFGKIGPIHGGGIPIFTAIVNQKFKGIINQK